MELLGLDWHAWLTVVLVIGMFVALIKTKIPADVIFLVIIALLLVTGCLPLKVIIFITCIIVTMLQYPL